MDIITFIREDKFFIDDDKNVVCTNNRYTMVIALSGYPHVTSTINITKEVISDAYFFDKNKFVEKYKDKLLDKAPLTIVSLFRALRNIIVDDKIPIKSKGDKKEKKGSRREQVQNLLNSGMTSPSEIARQLGTNAGYISLLIRKINESNKGGS